MLLRQDGRRYEHRHLPSAHHRLEGTPDGHLGLAETHVAAHEPVHGPRAFHVRLHVDDGLRLIAGFGEGEGGFEFLLPGIVIGKRVAGLRFALGLDLQQFGGEVEGGVLGGLPGLFPAAGADATELRLGLGQPDITADQVRLLQRHVQRDFVLKLQRDDLADPIARLEFGQAAVERDAVLQVHDKVAFHQLREVEQLVDGGSRRAGPFGGGAPQAAPAEDFGFTDDDKTSRSGADSAPRRG